MERPAARVTSHQPVRFRVPGEPVWRQGTAENVSRSGFLFTTFDRPPEVGARLEVSFAPDGDTPSRRVTTAFVVRRILHCWPDPCIRVAVQFAAPDDPAASLAAALATRDDNHQGGPQ